MKKEIREVIVWTLNRLGMYSEDAEELIYRTGNAETGYRHLRQVKGPAIGFFQVEPDTIKDIWDNYAMYRPEVQAKLWGLGFDETNMDMSVLGSIALQVAFCRLTYWRYPKPIPPRTLMEGQAKYWKIAYNTEGGKGTIDHFMEANGGRYAEVD